MSTRDDSRSKGPELLVDMIQHVTVALGELTEMDDSRAKQVAREIADRMAAHWGGQIIYFPKGLSYKLSHRDREIYDKFNGKNHSELVMEYGISLQWLYKIIKAMRREDIAARQGLLFSDEEEE